MRPGIMVFILYLALVLAALPAGAQSPFPSPPLPATPEPAGTMSPVPPSTESPAPGMSTLPSPGTLDILEKEPEEFYVHVLGERLMGFKRPYGPYSAEQRAQIARDRIIWMLRKPDATVENLKAFDIKGDMYILYDNLSLLVVTKDDARLQKSDQTALVKEYMEKIRALMITYQRETDAHSMTRNVALTLVLTILLLLVLILLFSRLHAFIRVRLQSMVGTTLKDFKIYNYTLFTGQRIADLLSLAARLFLFMLKLVLLFFYLTIVFSLFIWTRGLMTTITHYLHDYLVLALTALKSYLPNLAFILLTMVAAYYLLRGTGGVFNELEREADKIPWFHQDWAQPTGSIVKFLVVAMAIIIIIPLLPGYDSPAFKGFSLFLGIMGALGSTAIVANVLSGVIIIYMNAFRLGDRVRIGDTEGDIIEKNLLVTRIRTIKNVDVTIPNSTVLGAHIFNYSTEAKGPGLILNTSVTIGYDAPWRTVHRLLTEAALATEHIEKEPPPFIIQTALNDFYVAYELNAYTKEASMKHLIYGDLHGAIQDKFNEAGVEILSPHYRSLRDGNTVGIPGSYLPPGYVPPSFRVVQTAEEEKRQGGDHGTTA